MASIYKKSNNINLLQLEIKYWKVQTMGRAKVTLLFFVSIFAGFLLTLLYVLIWSQNMVNPTEFRSLLKNRLNKEFVTKRQDKQRIRKPADFIRSPC